MGASLHLTRIFGERIGHLSRYGRTRMLARELDRIAGALRAGSEAHAFRKAFFAAGGTAEHWEQYVVPVLNAVPLPSTVEPDPEEFGAESGEDRLWDALAIELAATHGQVAEADTDAADSAASDLWARHPCETLNASARCLLTMCRVSGRVLAVKIEGTFGGGTRGGQCLTQEVRGAVGAGVSGVLVDLRGVSALQFDGTGALAACQMNVQAAGGRVAVVVPRGPTGALIAASGLCRRARCFADAQSALDYLLAHSPRVGAE